MHTRLDLRVLELASVLNLRDSVPSLTPPYWQAVCIVLILVVVNNSSPEERPSLDAAVAGKAFQQCITSACKQCRLDKELFETLPGAFE